MAVKSSAEFRQRMVHFILIFAAVVLVVDALVGDKGLIESLKARNEYREVESSLSALRRENNKLAEDVRRLKEDPSAVEAIARQELGLVRRGEVLFLIRDAKPSSSR